VRRKKKGSEAEFQDAVAKYAQLRGWRVCHFRSATVRAGRTATPVAYDAAGFPDLVLLRRGVVVFAELKAPGRRALRPEQEAWRGTIELAVMANPHVHYYVWNPSDTKLIEEILR
jgi:hypothetical protein